MPSSACIRIVNHAFSSSSKDDRPATMANLTLVQNCRTGRPCPVRKCSRVSDHDLAPWPPRHESVGTTIAQTNARVLEVQWLPSAWRSFPSHHRQRVISSIRKPRSIHRNEHLGHQASVTIRFDRSVDCGLAAPAEGLRARGVRLIPRGRGRDKADRLP